MEKNECLLELDKIAELEDGWSYLGLGHKFGKSLIELCKKAIECMNVTPEIRPTIEDAIVFDYFGDKFNLELSISNDGFSGFVTDKRESCYSIFEFETLDDLIAFWNVAVSTY